MTSKLPAGSYRWAAISTHHLAITDRFVVYQSVTREDLEEMILNKAAHIAVDNGMAWNPFNVSLCFTSL